MKKIFTYLLMISIVESSPTFAKTIPLYSEPKSDSKTSGTVNTETGVTIVYTPKNSEWIKVANPSNGDVGWVKSNDLGNHQYNMQVITSDNGKQSYRVYQFGTNKQYTKEQIDKEMKRFEEQQHMLHQHIGQLFNDVFYFPQPFIFSHPIFVPVVLQENPNPKNTPDTNKEQKNKAS